MSDPPPWERQRNEALVCTKPCPIPILMRTWLGQTQVDLEGRGIHPRNQRRAKFLDRPPQDGWIPFLEIA